MFDFDDLGDDGGDPTGAAYGDRSNLACASPGCPYLVNSRWELGGYCCIACSEGGPHGPRCERIPAHARATKADAAWGTMAGDALEEKELQDALRRSVQEAAGGSTASAPPSQPADAEEARARRREAAEARQATARIKVTPSVAAAPPPQRLYSMRMHTNPALRGPVGGAQQSAEERQRAEEERRRAEEEWRRAEAQREKVEKARQRQEERLERARLDEQAKVKIEEVQKKMKETEEKGAVGVELGGKVLPKNAAKIINGGFYEALSKLVMRTEEDMDSDIVTNLLPESVIQVLEAGNGRRIKVRDTEGQEGWVSVCKADGKQLLLPRLSAPEPPLPGGFKRGQTIYWTRFSVRQDYDENYGSEGFCHGQAEDKRLQDQCVHAEFAWGKGDFFVRHLSTEPPAGMPGTENGPSGAAFPAAQTPKAFKPPERVPVPQAEEAPTNDAAPMLHEVDEKAAEVAESVLKNILPKIKQAEKLGMLTLRECGLGGLPKEATAPGLKKLRTADLSMNTLRSLPDAISTWVNMKTFTCSKNYLISLPAGVGQMTKLQKLDLSSNRMSRLPATMAELGCLKELNLSKNAFGPRLPDVFGGAVAKALEELDLSENNLRDLAPSLFGLEKLGRLLLQENSFQQLPEGLGRLERVHYLNAAENKLSSVPTPVLEMPALAELWLAGNPIDRQGLQEDPALEGLLRRREARINNILVSKVGPVLIDLRVCGLDG
uniref:Uncharacterized protein n=1 Tax=Alexandrium monilatum TaxID=311494 RepID=A0A7S4RNM5_9DINO